MVLDAAVARWARVWDSVAAADARWNVGVTVGVTAVAGVAIAAAILMSSRRGSLKSPWSRGKRKCPLSRRQWLSFFTPDGRLRDQGVKFLRKVRSGGVDPSIREEVWPFLLGVYDLGSSADERAAVRKRHREEYTQLRQRCEQLLKDIDEDNAEIRVEGESSNLNDHKCNEGVDSAESAESIVSEEISSDPKSLPIEGGGPGYGDEHQAEVPIATQKDLVHGEDEDNSGITHVNVHPAETESSDSESSVEELEGVLPSPDSKVAVTEDNESSINQEKKRAQIILKSDSPRYKMDENFTTWQRIIRLDAIRANDEWIPYSPRQAAVSEDRARNFALTAGLKDYDHLEPCRIYHAARLVAVLEAYALHDPDTGYCQGMSDLLSPILAVMEEDDDAFWCFVGFMRKARHNFRLDEVGIRRQLSIVSKIIKNKDAHLYRHLQKLQAEDCYFVYRMVVVMFRRELSFEQTLCLWEVVWADQAAIRAGFRKSGWGKMRLWEVPPPTEDLLLYAVAACVLQRRKLIIEQYSSMEEILRECNSMAGKLDIWRLLDDAHNLVATLQDRI